MAIRIRHLNCTTLCPMAGRLMYGAQRKGPEAKLVCHCLLIEYDRGLALVDTGYGINDVAHPHVRINEFFLRSLRPRLAPDETAVRQIERLGFRAQDVQHILLTHLDFDHAGGLDDFPAARIHVMAAERSLALARRTVLDRMRYKPTQWTDPTAWRTYEPRGEPWYGFECVHALEGLPTDVLFVPLSGHTLGHAGVAVRHSGGWLLHAGDAYFFDQEMNLRHPHCTPGLSLYQRMMEQDRTLRLHNQQRLRQLKREYGSEVTLFCSHDAAEFEQLKDALWTGRSDSFAQHAHPLPM